MGRVFLFLVLLFALAAGFAWLADRPGDLSLTWQGYRIETSLMVAMIALVAFIALLGIIGAALRGILAAPRAVGNFLGARRRDRGYRALSRGIIAVGAGDTRTARRAATEASSLLADEPLALLLTAQAAQLTGDSSGARAAFEALANRPDTRLLGLHGLFIEAARDGEHEAAQHFAEEAMRASPRIGWAGTALFDYQTGAGDWIGALKTLDANSAAGLIDKTIFRRRRALLLTALAKDIEGGDPTAALAHALEAHKLAPDLPEAAIVAARLHARVGDLRRASRVLETTWKTFPHPEIADSYAALHSGETVRDRQKRIRRLAEMQPGHAESRLATARAAVDAHDWKAARDAVQPLLAARPTEKVCLLMAEVEDGEHGDEGRVRQWLTRAFHAPRDSAWIADGRVFPHWAPVSPVSGKLDAFEWKPAGEPPAAGRTALIDAYESRAATEDKAERSGAIEITKPAPFDGEREDVVPDETAERADYASPIRNAPPTAPDPLIPPSPDDPGPSPVEGENPPQRFRLFGPSA